MENTMLQNDEQSLAAKREIAVVKEDMHKDVDYNQPTQEKLDKVNYAAFVNRSNMWIACLLFASIAFYSFTSSFAQDTKITTAEHIATPLATNQENFGLVNAEQASLNQISMLETLNIVDGLHGRFDEHVSQAVLNNLVQNLQHQEAFMMAFEMGDELFEHNFTAADGVGAEVGGGLNFANVPRADLQGAGEWANHFPKRSTGPNAQSCQACHNQPAGSTSAGSVALNVVRDPFHTGEVASFITRNTTHTFGSGAVQRLAEEMTAELYDLAFGLLQQVQVSGQSASVDLITKGVDFGSLTIAADGRWDRSAIVGIDDDLIVKPFQWKGSESTLRSFVVDASHNELGMQPAEMFGYGADGDFADGDFADGDFADGDFDGVSNELTVGDVTAMVIYAAAQPRPVTSLELAELKLIPELPQEKVNQIMWGEQLFTDIGCSTCHMPQMVLNDPVFSEPSLSAYYRDTAFNTGQELLALGLSPNHAVSFDLTKDLPDNIIELADGTLHSLGSFEATANGGAVVSLYGDLKRHDMGENLAESIDEVGTGAAMFLTKELWGVGDTAPYLHDGRASTLAEAILEHGGEAQDSRNAFSYLTEEEQSALVAFLDNLKLYLAEEEE